MASNLDALQNLPEIDFLGDLNITQETIAEEMLEDYQSKYEELTGKEITLYPANTERLKMQIVAGEIYQIYEYISYLFSQNFIQYMDREVLENWGTTLGYAETNIKAATCILQFSVNDVLDFDVEIPAGRIIISLTDATTYFNNKIKNGTVMIICTICSNPSLFLKANVNKSASHRLN